MKKIIALVLLVCTLLALSACESVKKPEDLIREFNEMGCVVRSYSVGSKFESVLNLFEIKDTSLVDSVIIAEGGTDKETAKPIIILFCTSKASANTVYDVARKTVKSVSEFIGIKVDDCQIVRIENAVLVGIAEMIEAAKVK